jgi:hypothetical protein
LKIIIVERIIIERTIIIDSWVGYGEGFLHSLEIKHRSWLGRDIPSIIAARVAFI